MCQSPKINQPHILILLLALLAVVLYPGFQYTIMSFWSSHSTPRFARSNQSISLTHSYFNTSLRSQFSLTQILLLASLAVRHTAFQFTTMPLWSNNLLLASFGPISQSTSTHSSFYLLCLQSTTVVAIKFDRSVLGPTLIQLLVSYKFRDSWFIIVQIKLRTKFMNLSHILSYVLIVGMAYDV